MNLGPWAISDMWASVGVCPYRSMSVICDSSVHKSRREEAKKQADAYQDEMRRG